MIAGYTVRHFLPKLDQFRVLQVPSIYDIMDVRMPVTGRSCDFNNVDTAEHLVLKILGLTESAERPDKRFYTLGKIGTIPLGQ